MSCRTHCWAQRHSQAAWGRLVTHAEVRGVYSLYGMQIFDHIEGDDTGTEFVIKCSYMEIYNEQVPSSCVPVH